MAEAPDKTTHAARRRLESRDGLRLKLRGAQYIRRLHEIADKAEAADKDSVPGLKLKAEVYFKLLNKILPDLRAMEHSGEINLARAEELTDEQLARIATGSSTGAAESQDSEPGPSEIH